MKNLFTATLAIATILVAHAQQAPMQPLASLKTNFPTFSHADSLRPNAVGEPVNAVSTSGVHPRALKDFAKRYKNAINPYWLKCDDGGAVAGFKTATAHHWVTYNKKGWWVHHIQNYGGDYLPKYIRKMVMLGYPDCPIISAEEVELTQKVVFIVFIQDENKVRIIRICEDEVEEIEAI